jgi:transaldolase / glucose-6-phosphate isomerase
MMKPELLRQGQEVSLMPFVNLGRCQGKAEMRLNQMEEQQYVLRLWSKDVTLWGEPKGSKEIVNCLGWLDVIEKMIASLPMLWKFETETKAAGFKQVVVMGMGGSSLSSFVFNQMVEPSEKGLPVIVLDTTDPETINASLKGIDLEETLFILASKSGTTTEPQALFEYFYNKLYEIKGNIAGENFVAITDPGTFLVKQAAEKNFRHVFLNYSDIGGRYSALSYFGIVPAVLMGVNVGEMLENALLMVHACSAGVPVRHNPGVLLGGLMGDLARQQKDKLTFFLPEKLKPFGLWLEQLIAESTGKRGTGILPVIGDLQASIKHYGKDRVFVFINLADGFDASWNEKMKMLEEEGHPVIKMELQSILSLGQEFFRWEVATAIAGAVMGINPFDQPNVQESKEITSAILKNLEAGNKSSEIKPLFTDKGMKFYGKPGGAPHAENYIDNLLSQTKEGDFVAIQAYLPETNEITNSLEMMRKTFEEGLHLAVTYGYGPRYLHSTGQLHKGGGDSGYFIILTGGNRTDLQIPGKAYTFGQLKNAQAAGDYEALVNHNKRVIRIDLGEKVEENLAILQNSIKEALSLQLKFV